MRLTSAFFLLLACAPAWAAPDALLSAMSAELERSFNGLRRAEKVPLHYLAYEVWDNRRYYAAAVLGALQDESDRRSRELSVDVRVGTRKLDNTHQVKGPEAWRYGQDERRANLPTGDDEAALRAALWLNTDDAYKDALNRFTKVETNKAVTASEEDDSDDFSDETPVIHDDRVELSDVDASAWRGRLKRLSLALKPYPFVFRSEAWLSAYAENRYLANSEGTRVITGGRYVRLGYSVAGRTPDGMDLSRDKTYDSDSLDGLPSDEVILRDMKASVAELEALLKAPLIAPYSGPAIIRNRATAVYFHEILGHRLEGHRQRLEGQGQTFTKMLGQRIVSPIINVYDDPTLSRFRGRFLRGAYAFDDEGVPARRVTLVERGVLKNFLMSRMPVNGFPRSNGHGRREDGHQVVPRMGNTIVEASETVTYDALRRKLIDEVKRQDKPYGLLFDDISGGFTMTTRDRPQSFKVIPRLVYRVYPDGRPDEPVRGVDIVGTPLTAFAKIAAAADDADIFNGNCGAESGWVPVSGVAPSVLVTEIEVEKKDKTSEKPPILPVPFHDPEKPR